MPRWPRFSLTLLVPFSALALLLAVTAIELWHPAGLGVQLLGQATGSCGGPGQPGCNGSVVSGLCFDRSMCPPDNNNCPNATHWTCAGCSGEFPYNYTCPTPPGYGICTSTPVACNGGQSSQPPSSAPSSGGTCTRQGTWLQPVGDGTYCATCMCAGNATRCDANPLVLCNPSSLPGFGSSAGGSTPSSAGGSSSNASSQPSSAAPSSQGGGGSGGGGGSVGGSVGGGRSSSAPFCQGQATPAELLSCVGILSDEPVIDCFKPANNVCIPRPNDTGYQCGPGHTGCDPGPLGQYECPAADTDRCAPGPVICSVRLKRNKSPNCQLYVNMVLQGSVRKWTLGADGEELSPDELTYSLFKEGNTAPLAPYELDENASYQFVPDDRSRVLAWKLTSTGSNHLWFQRGWEEASADIHICGQVGSKSFVIPLAYHEDMTAPLDPDAEQCQKQVALGAMCYQRDQYSDPFPRDTFDVSLNDAIFTRVQAVPSPQECIQSVVLQPGSVCRGQSGSTVGLYCDKLQLYDTTHDLHQVFPLVEKQCTPPYAYLTTRLRAQFHGVTDGSGVPDSQGVVHTEFGDRWFDASDVSQELPICPRAQTGGSSASSVSNGSSQSSRSSSRSSSSSSASSHSQSSRSGASSACSSRQPVLLNAGCVLSCPKDICQPCTEVCGGSSSSRSSAGGGVTSSAASSRRSSSVSSGRASSSSRASSARSQSSVRSSGSTSSNPTAPACSGLECSIVGNVLCASDHKQCVQLGTYPCLACGDVLPGPGSSAPSDGNESSGPALADAVCGDGEQQGAESCDDGNNDDGDGCSSVCQTEFTSAVSSSATLVSCGNAQLDAGEQCDDGNNEGGDGCSAGCLREVGKPPRVVQGLPAVNMALCGNGRLDPGEQCDDGNTESGDGCSKSCWGEVLGSGGIWLPSPLDQSANVAQNPSVLGAQGQFDLPSLQNPFNTGAGSPYTGSITSISTGHAPAGKTGPAAVTLMAAGAASGWAWMRRRRR